MIIIKDNKKGIERTRITKKNDLELHNALTDLYLELTADVTTPPVEPPPVEPPPEPPVVEDEYLDFQWPVSGDEKIVTQPFGVNPAQYEPWGVPAHEGIDMKAPEKTLIVAVWPGTVTRLEWHNAYGNHIRLSHKVWSEAQNLYLEYESVYAHFWTSSPLKVGDMVARGAGLGYAGTTGNSTGPHLHFMLKQFTGEKPDTEKQKMYDWPYDIIDPTPFFKELNADPA